MRILHTSDWHIGKKLNGRSRLDEQREVLAEIVSVCDDNAVDVVLVSGDVFDTYTPSAEAEELFFETIGRLANPCRAVVVISGNHDDWQRLCASSVLASRANVYVFGGEKAPAAGSKAPQVSEETAVYAEKTGSRFCIIKKGRDRVYVGALPYPTEKRLGEARDGTSFDEKMSRWISGCFEENTENLPQILLAHIYMLGGIGTDGERQIDLGGTRAVDKKLIPEECIYTALGHLHKRQVIDAGRNIIYSGAILEYGFDEAGAEKSVTLFELNGKTVENLKVIALRKGRRLARLSALSCAQGEELIRANVGRLIELTLYLDGPLSESETRSLISLPDLVQLRIQRTDAAKSERREDRRKMDERTAFVEYYKSCYNTEPPQELLAVYLGLMQNAKEDDEQ